MRQYKSPNNNFYTIVFDIAELKFLGTFRKECYSCRSTLASCWIIVTIKEVVSGGGHHGCSDQRRLGLHRHPPSWAGPCTAPCSPSCTAHNLYWRLPEHSHFFWCVTTAQSLKGSFTIFLFLVRSHILNSNGVWYWWFCPEGPINAQNSIFLGFNFVPRDLDSRRHMGPRPKILSLRRF